MGTWVDVGEYRYCTHGPDGRPVMPLGKGSYGLVYKGEHKKTKAVVAVKTMVNPDPNMNKHIDNELRIHKELNHPNLIRCYHVEDRRVGQVRHIAMVLEFMGGGDLESYLNKKYPGGMPENEARRFLCQIASAFQYLSSRRLSHRDLKPANMLLTDTGPSPVIKIGDFGFAREQAENTMMLSKVGSPLYMAPEVLKEQPYSSSADVWSTGIIFLQLLQGHRPFPNARVEADIINDINAGRVKPPANLSRDGADLLNKTLTPDPRHRMNWESFLAHEYVRPTAAAQPLAASVFNGEVNWMLTTMSFETGYSITANVNASMTIEALKQMLGGALDPSRDARELMLISRSHGLMIDNHTVGDYFKPPAHTENVTSLPDNTVYACWEATWNGFFPAERKTLPSTPTLENVLSLSQLPSSYQPSDAAKWHSIFTFWKSTVEAHIQHAEDLKDYAGLLHAEVRNIGAVVSRRSAYIAFQNHLRASYNRLIERFEPMSLVLKEVAQPMESIRAKLPALFPEMRKIPLLPLCEAFPMLNLDRSATLAHLINEAAALNDLDNISQTHKKLLAGELMFSPSSDPVAAEKYGIEGARYTGNTFNAAVAVATPTSGVKTPILIASMAEINNLMASVKFFLIQRIEAAKSEILQSLSGIETRVGNFVKTARFALDALAIVLSRPPSFMLTEDMLTPVIGHIKASATDFTMITTALSELKPLMTNYVESRYQLDQSFSDVLTQLQPLKRPFADFETMFKTDWPPEALDRLRHKATSLNKLLSLPQDYKDLLTEIERRRKWTEVMYNNVDEANRCYGELIAAEQQQRDAWFQTHQTLMRFSTVLPRDFELLRLSVPDSMRIVVQHQGINPYPKLNTPLISQDSSSPSSSSTSPPRPQNPTEEAIARLGSRTLLDHAFNLQREVDILQRQKTNFFQLGTDEVLRKENLAQAEVISELKARVESDAVEIARLRAELAAFRGQPRK